MPRRTKKARPKRAKILRIAGTNLSLRPISKEEMNKILRRNKDDDEIARAWNLRLLPFLINNYEELEKARKLRKRIKRGKKTQQERKFLMSKSERLTNGLKQAMKL